MQLLLFSYPYRDIHKPPIELAGDIRIIQISPARTGSTLIYNVLRYLFENSEDGNQIVMKSHDARDLTTKTLAGKRLILCKTIRDPLNIMASRKKAGFQHYNMRVIDPLSNIKVKINAIKSLTFKYESFSNDRFDYIFNIIENRFDVHISKFHKDEIRKYFSLCEMKKIQDTLSNFNEWDHDTGIHGKHINDVNWKRDLTLKEAIGIYELNYDLRRAWGYPPLDVFSLWKKFRSQSN